MAGKVKDKIRKIFKARSITFLMFWLSFITIAFVLLIGFLIIGIIAPRVYSTSVIVITSYSIHYTKLYDAHSSTGTSCSSTFLKSYSLISSVSFSKSDVLSQYSHFSIALSGSKCIFPPQDGQGNLSVSFIISFSMKCLLNKSKV